MTRIVLVLLGVGCAACGSAGPVVTDRPPPDVVPTLAVVAPAPVLAPIEPPAPLPPPAAPPGSLTERHAYPRVGVTEWTLANGLGVVYKRLPDVATAFLSVATPGEFAVRGRDGEAPDAAPAWTGHVPGELWADLPDPSLAASVALAQGVVGGQAHGERGEHTVVLVGPWPEDEVESLVGHGLARTGGAPPSTHVRTEPAPSEILARLTVPFRWADVPALLVLQSGLDARPGVTAQVAFDARDGTATLRLAATEGPGDRASALAPLAPDEMTGARRRALDRWGPDAPAGWGRLLQALWAEPGDFRPARDPAVVGRVLADLVRVAPDAVDTLLAALRAAARPVSPR